MIIPDISTYNKDKTEILSLEKNFDKKACFLHFTLISSILSFIIN